MQSKGVRPRPRGGEICLLALLLAAASLIRFDDLTLEGLWTDELMASTFAPLGFKDMLVAVARFDVHPPAYNVQLNLWALLFGCSDRALLANSVAWGVVTLVTLWAVARRLIEPTLGLPAAAAAAVGASQVYYSQELRQYAMLSALMVVAWWSADRYVKRPDWRETLVLVLLVTVIAATHAASFVPISCIAVYLLLSLGWRASLQWRHLRVFLSMGFVILPWLVNSMIRGVAHIPHPSMQAVATTLAGWLYGYHPALSAPALVSGTVIVLVAVTLAVRRPATRTMALAFIVWPLLFVLTVSLSYRDLWIPRLFEFCAPFTSVALAAACVGAWKSKFLPTLLTRAATGVGACLLAASMFTAALTQADPGRKTQYREAAAFLRARAAPDSIIYAPEHFTFWGFARYLAGPTWGSPLAIQDPVRPGRSMAWDPIYARLGPDRLRWLNLVPIARELSVEDRKLVVGWTPAATVQGANTVWLVTSKIVELDEVAMGDVRLVNSFAFQGLLVREMQRANPR